MFARTLEDGARVARAVQDALTIQDRLTAEELKAQGKALRQKVPFDAQGVWVAPEDRPDPVDLLFSQDSSRMQSLVPLRHERMAASPFTFYRGAALIMASDLSRTPSTGITVQACGDAHIANFGMYRSPEERMVFDINDFDETSRGPWEWDLKRLATSVEICARDRGFSPEERERAVDYCLKAYHGSMLDFAKMGHLDVWYDHVDLDELTEQLSYEATEEERHEMQEVLKKVKQKDNSTALVKLTEVVDGQLRFKSNPPLLVPLRDMVTSPNSKSLGDSVDVESLIRMALAEYRQTLPPETRHVVGLYQAVDAAHKVVGVGSVGTVALVVALEGADRNDVLVLQIKEAQESVLERFCGKSGQRQHGQRVVEGQRALQSVSDLLLGWCRIPFGDEGVKDFYVRQLWNGKSSPDLRTIDAEQLAGLASICGWTLSHAHARTGDRFKIAGYLGKNDDFDDAVIAFAQSYADQNEADYKRFVQALADKK